MSIETKSSSMIRLPSSADQVVDYAVSLHMAGAPAHVVEGAVGEVMAREGIVGSVLASPTAMWFQLGDQARVVRLRPASLNLDHLDGLLHQRRLGDFQPTDSPWGPKTILLATLAAAVFPALMLGDTWADPLVALIGAEVLRRVERAIPEDWSALFMTIIAFVAASVAHFGTLFSANEAMVSLSLVIILLPGLGMTLAVAEVAHGQLSAGSARFWGVVSDGAQLALGLTLGATVWPLLPHLWAFAELPGFMKWVAPALAPLSFAVLMGTRPSHIKWVVPVTVLVYSLASLLPTAWAPVVATFVLGLIANYLYRTRGVVNLVLIVPGILLLVPGSVGVSGLVLLQSDVVIGLGTVVSALSGAAALVLGLLLSHALLPARRFVQLTYPL